MPNAKSLPFGELLTDGHFLPVAKLKQKFDALKQSMINDYALSCGSGVTACILALAATSEWS